MKKIYYIIIFVLIIALAMMYFQLIDYQKITTSLLENNKQSLYKIDQLKNNKINLENQNNEYQIQITTLEENLVLQKIELEKQNTLNNNLILEKTKFKNNNTFNTNTDNLSLDKEVEMKKGSLTPSISPNIDLNEENEVTGFGLQYEQKF